MFFSYLDVLGYPHYTVSEYVTFVVIYVIYLTFEVFRFYFVAKLRNISLRYDK